MTADQVVEEYYEMRIVEPGLIGLELVSGCFSTASIILTEYLVPTEGIAGQSVDRQIEFRTSIRDQSRGFLGLNWRA